MSLSSVLNVYKSCKKFGGGRQITLAPLLYSPAIVTLASRLPNIGETLVLSEREKFATKQ